MTYKELNDSFTEHTLIYHLGIDAGFFAEYKYMVSAMLYCLENHIKFKLYSADANFGSEKGKGWTEYFEPFCDIVYEDFNHKYNRHNVPPFSEIIRRAIKHRKLSLISWKLKSLLYSNVARLKAKRLYGNGTLLNIDIKPITKKHYYIPQLGIDGDYAHAFNKITDIIWHFNEATKKEYMQVLDKLRLPSAYIGCQVRGGDKITEVSLLSPDLFVETIRQNTIIKDVFVLTDDYTLYEYLRDKYTDMRFYTLCDETQKGYVNSDFTKTSPERKHRQMSRFLASMQILQDSTQFIGSITTGPSVFALIRQHPHSIPVDYDPKLIAEAYNLPIEERGVLSANYLTGKRNSTVYKK